MFNIAHQGSINICLIIQKRSQNFEDTNNLSAYLYAMFEVLLLISKYTEIYASLVPIIRPQHQTIIFIEEN